MLTKLKVFGKDVKQMVEDKITTFRQIVLDKQSRLVLSLSLMGLGAGLFASLYVQIPNN